jgi:hypothetical protein
LGHGLREWRFVAPEWESPIARHRWWVVEDQEIVRHWRTTLAIRSPQTWHLPDGSTYVAEVSYDPALRPVLVLVGGIL